MTTLIAIVQAANLQAIESALDGRAVCMMSATPVHSYGPEPGHLGVSRGNTFRVRRGRLRLEVTVDDAFVAPVAGILGRFSAAADDDPSVECLVFKSALEPVEGLHYRG